MFNHRRNLNAFVVLFLTLALYAPTANAKGSEYKTVCNHLKTKYRAKKVKVPFMWLARAAVGIVKPAGVKSFKVTIFRNLQFSENSLHSEMQAVMKDAFDPEWSPILRVRSRDGEQVYMNMREAGKSVKIVLVTIQKDEAVVVRARFNPNKLVRFIENPRIMGISLDGGNGKKRISISQEDKEDKDDGRIIFEDDSEDEEESRENPE